MTATNLNWFRATANRTLNSLHDTVFIHLYSATNVSETLRLPTNPTVTRKSPSSSSLLWITNLLWVIRFRISIIFNKPEYTIPLIPVIRGPTVKVASVAIPDFKNKARERCCHIRFSLSNSSSDKRIQLFSLFISTNLTRPFDTLFSNFKKVKLTQAVCPCQQVSPWHAVPDIKPILSFCWVPIAKLFAYPPQLAYERPMLLCGLRTRKLSLH